MNESAELSILRDENTLLRATNEALEALFDLQHARDIEASLRWRAEDPEGRALRLPDRGNLLDWVWVQLRLAENDRTIAMELIDEIVKVHESRGDNQGLHQWLNAHQHYNWLSRAHELIEIIKEKTMSDQAPPQANPDMPGSPLINVIRCQRPLGDSVCNSPIYYDWGIQVMERVNGTLPTGDAGKFKNYAHSNNVFICARCTTPYIKVEGDMVDISYELSAEDIKLILARGQATLPQVKIKDP